MEKRVKDTWGRRKERGNGREREKRKGRRDNQWFSTQKPATTGKEWGGGNQEPGSHSRAPAGARARLRQSSLLTAAS